MGSNDKFSATFNPDGYGITSRTFVPKKFGAYALASMRMSKDVDNLDAMMSGQLMYRMEAMILSDTLARDTYTGTSVSRWPATTWQMFKHTNEGTWWLGWLVRRRPVRMANDTHTVEVNVERCVLYPEANMVPESFGRPVIYEQVTQR